MRRAVALILVVTVCACGGGGGGGGDDDGGDRPAPTVSFAGLYQMVRLERSPQGDSLHSLIAQTTHDAGGSIQLGDAWGDTGQWTNVPGDWTYELLGGQALRVAWTTIGGRWLGAVSADGELAAATDLGPGRDPTLLLFVKRDPEPQQSDLIGDWHLFSWGESGDAGVRSESHCTKMSVDATGLITYHDDTWNRDGAIDEVVWSPASTQLRVGADGWILQETTATQFVIARGALSRQHDLVVLAKTDGGTARVRLLVRYDQAANVAALDGSYFAAGFGYAHGPFACDAGSADLDGQGGGQWTRTYNEDGALEEAVSSLTNSVSFNGSGQVRVDAAPRAELGVGPSGRYVVWGGYVTAGSNPMIRILFR